MKQQLKKLRPRHLRAGELRAEGHSLSEIARMMDVSEQTVSGWINTPALKEIIEKKKLENQALTRESGLKPDARGSVAEAKRIIEAHLDIAARELVKLMQTATSKQGKLEAIKEMFRIAGGRINKNTLIVNIPAEALTRAIEGARQRGVFIKPSPQEIPVEPIDAEQDEATQETEGGTGRDAGTGEV